MDTIIILEIIWSLTKCIFGYSKCDQVVSGPFRMDREGRRKRGESVELSTHNSAGRTPGQN